jgi:hypothetical protein
MAKDMNISNDPEFYFDPNSRVTIAVRLPPSVIRPYYMDAYLCKWCGSLVPDDGRLLHIKFHVRVGL